MAKPAIAVVVAGNGEIAPAEVADLMNDFFPSDEVLVDLIVPVDKDRYTDAVHSVVEWFNDDKNVYPVKTKDVSMSRLSSKLGESVQEVDSFAEILMNPEEDYSEWDDVVFVVALPNEDDPEYDDYVQMAQDAIDAGITTKDLCQGLDDVVIDDSPEVTEDEESAAAEEPAEEPEEETAEDTEPEAPQEPEVLTQVALEAQAVSVEPSHGSFVIPEDHPLMVSLSNLIGSLSDLYNNLAATERYDEDGAEVTLDIMTKEAPVEAAEEPVAPAEKAQDGRGRPRVNFEVKQIWSEDEDAWIARPKGRMRKGTEWRVIDTRTDEVLESGTA